MFVKLESREVAEALIAMGFSCIKEKLNGQTFYCFRQSPELAEIILNKFADVRLYMDTYLRF